ncbi:hypothetical protein PR048_028156 [Dryococelus australis]|uniref:Uncharacterized protein n=1 Tax=Dryococelus australis TaxID=614101 RepID=A0ABQ9GIH3_9NEOP|nr:hypothetical protein PR048_028156 [Dryococelus australis]
MDLRGNPTSKVKKLGNDTGDTNTHFKRLIAPTRKACSRAHYSPPTEVNRVRDPVGLLLDFRTWDSRRLLPVLKTSHSQSDRKRCVVLWCNFPDLVNLSLHGAQEYPAIEKLHYTINGAAVAEQLACSPPTEGGPCSIAGRVTPGFSHVGILPDDASCRRVFSGISRFPRPLIPVLLHNHLNHSHQLSRPRC